ncbi:MAG: metallophosphoesterase family protein [Bacteroidales bacterium]|nr:metallophosphoesterase family protein [Bacteroidales bacterium]
MNYTLSDKEKNQRLVWSITRSVLETDSYKHKRQGKKSKSHWNLFTSILGLFVFATKILGLFQKGKSNVFNISINQHRLAFPDLPAAFDGFKILHLSDLHIDAVEGLDNAIIERIKKVDFNLCVLTGDYRKESSGVFTHILSPIEKISKQIQSEFGPLAILGNHDTYLMANYEEESGMRLLINEKVELKRGEDKIIVSGTDDPFSFYTSACLMAFTPEKAFKIAMVHTSELADIAAENDYNLYLCGHTHGGQICLPGGKALISHQTDGNKHVKGFWQLDKMIGYTSVGCGVSGVPLRFNCMPEITVFELVKEQS